MKIFSLFSLASMTAGFERKPTGGIRPCDYFRRTAKVEFKGPVQGTITFVSTSCGGQGVTMKGSLRLRNIKDDTELPWHVHQLGKITRNCDETGDPFNPYNAPSGSFDKHRASRFVGQIKPLTCSKGKCEVDQVDKVIKLHGMANVVGRSLVIHKPNGDPLACGAIVWSETDSRNILSASTTYANYPV